MSCRRLAFASLALALVLNACAAPAPVGSPSGSLVPEGAVIYVVGRGWHTDIGLPVAEISGPLATLEDAFPGVHVLTFGFGERQFLVNRMTTFGSMLKALLPSQSALLVTALRTTPETAFGSQNVVALHIAQRNLELIEASIWQEFERSSNGEPILLAEGPYSGSVFYAALDTYDGFYTCNTWTAKTMRAGGLPVPAIGVLFASQVMGMARWIGMRQASYPLVR